MLNCVSADCKLEKAEKNFGKPVNGGPNSAKPDTNHSTNPTNPTTKYRCELDMCCLIWYRNSGPHYKYVTILTL